MSHKLASKIGEALAAPIRRGRVRFRTKAVRDYVEKSQAISAAGLRTDPATLAAVEREMFGDNLAFRPTGETMSKTQNFAEETGHAAAPGGEFIRHFGAALAGGEVDYGEPYEPDAEIVDVLRRVLLHERAQRPQRDAVRGARLSLRRWERRCSIRSWVTRSRTRCTPRWHRRPDSEAT